MNRWVNIFGPCIVDVKPNYIICTFYKYNQFYSYMYILIIRSNKIYMTIMRVKK
jgi:hypothetical protein